MNGADLRRWVTGFPGWRLGGKIKDAADGRLESAGESCVRWEYACGALVVLAVAAEIVIAWIHPKYDSWLMQWGSVICDAAIALGVGGEILFSSRSHNFSSELTRRANDRLGRLKEAASWRSLSRERHSLTEILQRATLPAAVRISLLANDPESMFYAEQFAHAFRAAGWSAGYRFESYNDEILHGVMLPPQTANRPADMAALNLLVAEAFDAAQISYKVGWPEQWYTSQEGGDPLIGPLAFVYIGPKPMPALE